MKESTNNIVANIQRRQDVALERAKLKKEAKELRDQQGEINKAFISEQLESFIKEMRVYPNDYILGIDSHPFTKFVNRNGLSINAKHGKAMNAFNDAKKNLAKEFVSGILENNHNEREKIVRYADIKNIKDMARYF